MGKILERRLQENPVKKHENIRIFDTRKNKSKFRR